MLALDEMDSAEIGRYLVTQNAIADCAPLTVAALGGGVSNIVLKVTTPAVKAPAQCLVLKQALPELRVQAYWPSRIDRALREAEALRIAADYLPNGAVPEVFFIDEENFIYGMSCAPAAATLWKEDLLAGNVDVDVAAAVGRLLGQMHAIQDPAVKERFIDDEVFWQLRVDPYYNTTAAKHPSVAPVIARAAARMQERKLALVHGDYSPKNMFVVPGETGFRAVRCAQAEASQCESDEEKMDSRFRGNDGGGAEGAAAHPGSCRDDGEGAAANPSLPRGDGGGETVDSSLRRDDGEGAAPNPGLRGSDGNEAPSMDSTGASAATRGNAVLLLDFEVVHWGDPAFDLAFCINHLLIKAVVNSHAQEAYFRAVTAFMEGYRALLPDIDWAELRAETTLQLGCLMLARIDGKSPVEYITEEPTKETVRRVSMAILQEQPGAMEDIYATIAGETAR